MFDLLFDVITAIGILLAGLMLLAMAALPVNVMLSAIMQAIALQ